MFRKELAYYFTTPVAYIVIGLYLLGVSLFLWVIPGEWNIVDSGYAQVDGLFMLSPWFFMLLCPALTMRLFAEERASGMWDLLRTKPISVARIVVDKYLASMLLVVVALLPCLTHYAIVAWMAEPMGNLDIGQFTGSMIGLLLLSSAFMALSLLVAALSKSQIVCFMLSALLCFVAYWVSMQEHYSSLSRGVLDLLDVVYFATIVVVAIVGCIFILDRS